MRALTLKPPTDEERKVIDKLASSRTAPAVQVRRAQLLKQMAQGASAPQAATVVSGITGETARQLLTHFNQAGVKALEDRPRSRRPPTITQEDRGRLVMLAQSPPPEGLAESSGACYWTLDTPWPRPTGRVYPSVAPIYGSVGPVRSAVVAPVSQLAGGHCSGTSPEKGDIVGFYTHPPEESTVVCVEEKGPVAAKLYPARGQ